MSALDAFKKLEANYKLKQRQIYCPTSNIRALTTGLTTGDDLTLKTMVASPDLYNRELVNLVFKHSEFPDLEKKPSFEYFITSMSDFDKRSLLLGIFISTFGTFGKQTITCPNCKNEFNDTINADELIQDDFAQTLWDKEIPFSQYSLPVEIPMNNEEIEKVVFHTSIPTIKQHFEVMKMVNKDSIKSNFEKFGQMFSKTEELTLVTRSISIHSANNTIMEEGGEQPKVNPPMVLDKVRDIHIALNDFITFETINEVVNQFNDEFAKYNPKFRKPYECVECLHRWDFHIDVETALFRNFFRVGAKSAG